MFVSARGLVLRASLRHDHTKGFEIASKAVSPPQQTPQFDHRLDLPKQYPFRAQTFSA